MLRSSLRIVFLASFAVGMNLSPVRGVEPPPDAIKAAREIAQIDRERAQLEADRAREQLAVARALLDRAIETQNPEEWEAAKKAYSAARAKLTEALIQLDTLRIIEPPTQHEHAVKQYRLAHAQMQVDAERARVQAAQSALARAKEVGNEKDIDEAIKLLDFSRAKLAQAEADLAALRARDSELPRARDAEPAVPERRIDQLRQRLEAARAKTQASAAVVDLCKRNFERATVIGKAEEIAEAKARLEVANAQLQQAKAEVDHLASQLAREEQREGELQAVRRMQEMELMIRRMREENEALRAKLEEMMRHFRDKPVDRPADRHEIKVITLRHAPAQHIQRIIHQLFEGEARFRCVIDERLNSVILRGGPETLEMMEAIIARLDQPAEARGEKVKPPDKDKPFEDKKPEPKPHEDKKREKPEDKKQAADVLLLQTLELARAQVHLAETEYSICKLDLTRATARGSAVEIDQADARLVRAQVRLEAALIELQKTEASGPPVDAQAYLKEMIDRVKSMYAFIRVPTLDPRIEKRIEQLRQRVGDKRVVRHGDLHEVMVFQLEQANAPEMVGLYEKLYGDFRYRCAVDHRTNSICVRASPDVMLLLEATASRLDRSESKLPNKKP